MGLAWITGGALILSGCGQKGSLYLPTDPDAAQRATLPRALRNTVRTPKAPHPSASAASAAASAASNAAIPESPASSPQDDSVPKTAPPPPALPDIPAPQ